MQRAAVSIVAFSFYLLCMFLSHIRLYCKNDEAGLLYFCVSTIFGRVGGIELWGFPAVVEGNNSYLPFLFLKPTEASKRSSGCFTEGGCSYLLYQLFSRGGR